MTAIDDGRLATLRQRLESLILELAAQTAGTRESTNPVDLDEPIGRISRMDAIQEQSMAQANRSAALRRLALARAALERLDAGEYGECAGCGEDIALARLEAAPESALCVVCQTSQEGRR